MVEEGGRRGRDRETLEDVKLLFLKLEGARSQGCRCLLELR